MKLRINYDFFNAIKDVNEGFTPMKIVRNNKRILVTFSLPLWLILDFYNSRNLSYVIKLLLIQFFGFYMGGQFALRILIGKDIYEEISSNRLKSLVYKLRELYVETDYNLLIQSELQTRKYNIHLNEYKIPELIEHKYVLVPSYDFNGNVKNVSIDQEHIVGTKDYVLSIGSPKKELKLAYSKV